MMKAAVDSGATAVKLQSYTTTEFINTANSNMAPLAAIFKQCELDIKQHDICLNFAAKHDIPLFSTILTPDYISYWKQAGSDFAKVASGDLDNFPLHLGLIKECFSTIISTGANTIEAAKRTKALYETQGTLPLAFLHCVSLYPTSISKVNLSRIHLLQQATSLPIGFSDHSDGCIAAMGAIVAGARVIEKHFTLDKNAEGPDHLLSADPKLFRQLRRGIEKALRLAGSGNQPFDEEIKADYFGKRSIYSTDSGLKTMRPREESQVATHQLGDLFSQG